MEEESEKNLLPQQESVETETEQKDESVNNETTLLPESEAEKPEEKKIQPKNRFLKMFERKKIRSSENLEVPAKEKEPEPKPTRTRPNFSGFFNKFRRGKYDVTDNAVELGTMNNEPKAGLASMETLDDSTKDPWGPENGSPDAKVPNDEEAGLKEIDKAAEAEEDREKTIPIWQACWQNIINYQWSIDDIALVVGILIFFILVSLIILFTFSGTTKKSTSAPIRGGKVLAVTSCGYVEGIVEENAAIAFRGIPYARPPTGNLRFEPAQPLDDLNYCWNGTLQTHNASNVCLQKNDKDEIIGSEDCLYLDVLTPEVRYINLLPVILMIGSNNFVNGSPGILRPSTRYSRSKSVVFVRPNFRMGVLGYLALESLSNSSDVPSSGNYALTDLITVLEWIELNIVNFGGDPKSVTILGHRTGATLATALSAIPRANKRFKQVWASSGSFHFPGESLDISERNNLGYAGLFPECKEKSAWQLKEASELINKMPKEWSTDYLTTLPSYNENSSDLHDWIVLDGVNLKKHPEDFWKSSTQKLPQIVIGTTAHVAYDPIKNSDIITKNLTEDEIEAYIKDSKVGQLNLTEEAFKRYGKTKEGLISMISDIRVVCPLFAQARSQPNIAFYVVTQTQKHESISLADVDSDIQAILGRYTCDTPEKRRYQESISKLFYYFVYHGKVNSFSQQKPVLEIEQDVAAKSDYANCDFWIANQMVPHYSAYY